MKKIFCIAALVLTLGLFAATKFEVGLNDGGAPNGCTVTGVIVVSTNATATCTVKAVYVMGTKAVTNELYSLTCSAGIATSDTKKLVAPNAKILVTGEAVTLFQE